jgi:hypothetical protein
MNKPPVPPDAWVELSQFEAIAARGTREVTWFWRLAVGDGWQNIASLPSAQSERLDPGAGMVWQSQVRVLLPYGSYLMRVDSAPAPPERLDALDYLRRERRQVARRVVRQYFRVGRRGALVRAPSSP